MLEEGREKRIESRAFSDEILIFWSLRDKQCKALCSTSHFEPLVEQSAISPFIRKIF